MKLIPGLFLLVFLALAPSLMAESTVGIPRYIKPAECQEAKYTCVLKVVDQEAFWCVKPTRDRYKNANRSPRTWDDMKCVKRYMAKKSAGRDQNPQPE